MGKRVLYALVTIALGVIAGAFAWAFFFLMNTGINLLWNVVPSALDQAGLPAIFYPIAFCIAGGLVIGIFSARFGDYPQDMNTVLAEVKKTGRYEYKHILSSFFGALLPLLFGGSIGPEAGLTGVIAGLCTWVGDRLRAVGAEMRELTEAGCAAVVSAIFATPLFGLTVPVVGAADDSQGSIVSADKIDLKVPKPLKVAVYLLAVVGALGSMLLLGMLFGANGGLPHFSDMEMGLHELAWFVPLALVGIAAGWLFYPAEALARKISDAMGKHKVIKPVFGGVLLGLCGTALPFVMFAGEAQTEELSEIWTTMLPAALIATGFLKVIMTQFCLNLGWRGGHFFPIIFAGISIGYGMALLCGIDPVFCLCVVTAALVGAVMRQPVMCALLLFLVFPIRSVIVLLAAAALASLVPVPKKWLKKSSQKPEREAKGKNAQPTE